MSEMKRHIGKIKKVDLNGFTIEEWCKRKCESLGVRLKPWNDTYKDAFFENQYPIEVVEVDGDLFEIIEDNEEEDTEEISIFTPNGNGTYSYVLQFYNGGTCLSEMIEEGIKKLRRNNDVR